MTWVKIDDGVGTHRKQLAAGPVACWLWVAGLAWANQHASDGAIPAHALHALYPSDWISKAEVRRAASRLVEVGLWEVATCGGWSIHDYVQYQGEAMRSARDERRQWEAERKARQRAAKKNASSRSDSGDLGGLSHRDTGGTGGGTITGTKGGTASRAGTPGVSQPPGPARPVQTGDTHTRAGGGARCGTVELFGIGADEVVTALRAGSKDRINLAHDSRTLADLGAVIRDLSTRGDEPVAGVEPYQVLAAWIGAGGLAWYDHGAPTLAYLLKPGVLAQHLAEAAAWHRGGRQALKSRKASPATATRPPGTRTSGVGPLPPAPRSAFEHASLAAKLGLRWRAPTDGSDRDAAWLAQTGMTVDEARARAACPAPPAATGT